MVRSWLGRIPGAVETALLLRDAIAPLPSSSMSWKALPAWLKELDGVRNDRPSRQSNVLVFAVNEGWIRFSLAVSMVLLARGCTVDFVFLPYVEFDREELPHALRTVRFYSGKFLQRPPHPGLRIFDLTKFAAAPLNEPMRQAVHAQSLYDTQWTQTREDIHIGEGGADRNTFDFRLRRNSDCMSRLAPFLQARKYDVILTPNGNLVEFGVLFRLGQILGRQVTSFEFGERLNTIVCSRHAPVVQFRTTPDWNREAPHRLSSAARSRVQELIAARQQIHWEGFAESYQTTQYEGASQALLDRLHMANDGRPIALLCPNIPWDSAWLGLDRIFPSMLEWLYRTIDHFARTNQRLLVRIHPAEATGATGEPLQDAIQRRFPELPGYIRIIGPSEPVNTYDLMDICHLGLVYNSTTGMEMALRGIPAVVAANPHYAEKGFTFEPKTIEDYFHLIGAILADPGGFRLSPDTTDLARCYADFYYFRWPKPFPWHPRTLWKDLEQWPIGRVLSSDGKAAFGDSFDALLGNC